MKRYNVKSRPGITEFVEILSETEEGYRIRLTKIQDGEEKIQEEFINHHLFDICVNTGFLFELVEELGVSAA
jgi:hypothetical protein